MSKGRVRKSKQATESGAGPAVDRTPPWSIIYYRAAGGTVPALDYLASCPGKLDGEFIAVLDAVAAAPPPQFSGGGKWEAMHGDMTGYYEIRLTGPSREQFRLSACSRTARTMSSSSAASSSRPSR